MCGAFVSENHGRKTEKIASTILYNDFTGDYTKLLKKSSKSSREVKHLRNPALEIIETESSLNHPNPKYRNEIHIKLQNIGTKFIVKLQNIGTKFI